MSSERGAGLLLVLSAPSGSGKTTLARQFVARHRDASFSVSATTREPRGEERDGVDYHFVSPARFAELVGRGAFAEWAEVHGQRYGTLKETVELTLAQDRIAVFDIDVQGGAQLEALWPRQALTVFVLPPTPAELERRLRGRSTDAEEVIARRLRAARAEVERGLAQYDYVIVNDVLDDAYRALEAIVRAARGDLAGAPDPAARAEAERHRLERLDLTAWA
ncbi:MAG TPA: guanylate kinase [Anaeromyxobacteraceae bacterium]|jgi:guanylate kinase|nr:guanylate kinase [Anaeromyxobacteraceae bacterium]